MVGELKGSFLESDKSFHKGEAIRRRGGDNGKVPAPHTTGRWNRTRGSREVKMESRKARLKHPSSGTEETRMTSEAESRHSERGPSYSVSFSITDIGLT